VPDVPAVIPKPARLEASGGAPFVFSESTTVVVNGRSDLIGIAVLAADLLGRVSGRAIEIRYAETDAPDVVRLRLTGQEGDDDESYTLASHAGRVDLEARSPAGLIRAIVTLRQLMVTAPDGTLQVPSVLVEDAPRYGWRGLSIDVARHFVAKRDLKVILGLMAHYKLNVLHLHLTDDQGWRLQVRSRPQLTRLSSSTSVNGDPGGHYTADDYAEIIAFAAVRGIRVVPEIDVPGHVNAATHAYGNLTPSGEPTDAYTGIEVGFSRLYADLPATGDFLREVFADVAAMTPGDYVHIGGDEVLTMEPAEYASLVATASDAVRATGKKVVGWQEIASTPLEPGTVVQYWDTRVDPAPFVAAAQAGALLLMSPGSKAYLDMKYDASTALGLEWAGHIELRDAYEWEPSTLIPGVPEASVIGVEAAVWTETLRDLSALTSMLLPRLAAIAEVAWTAPENRDWSDFRSRVAGQAAFWDRLGLSWYRSPQVDW